MTLNRCCLAWCLLLACFGPGWSAVGASYVVEVIAGWNGIANQLDRGANTVSDILPVVPDGTRLFKFNNKTKSYDPAETYFAGLGWDPGTTILHPGEGALLEAPSSFRLAFAGTPRVPKLPLDLPAGGTCLVSRQTNGVGTFENIVGRAPFNGTVVYDFNPGPGRDPSLFLPPHYTVYTYSNGWSPGAPLVAVGDSVWIQNPSVIAPTNLCLAIHCPPNLAARTCSNSTRVTYSVAATNRCGDGLNLRCSPPSGESFPVGVTTVTCVAAATGQTATCTFTITVRRDLTAPLLACPTNLLLTTCSNSARAFWSVTARDDGDLAVGPVCLPPPGSLFPVGTNAVLCSAGDDCGNRRTCEFQVVVQPAPATKPLVCPADLVVRRCKNALEPVFWNLATEDASDPVTSVFCDPPSGSVFPPGANTVLCRSVDPCGRISSCSFQVKVVLDEEPPVLACPDNIFVRTCGRTEPVHWNAAARDEVDGLVEVQCLPPSGSLFQVGTNLVFCTARDACQNRASCSFRVIVAADTQAPVIVCATNRIIASASPDGMILDFNLRTTTPTASGPVVCVPPSGSRFPIGTTVVQCGAEDDCGNRAACSFTVTLVNSCLVKNPSFESVLAPGPLAGSNQPFAGSVPGWTNLSGNPVLFTALEEDPGNFAGAEPAWHGSNYAGFASGSIAGIPRVEVLAGDLSSPVVAGQWYCVSARFSRADLSTARQVEVEVLLARSGSALPELFVGRQTIERTNGWELFSRSVLADRSYDRVVFRTARSALSSAPGYVYLDNVLICACRPLHIRPRDGALVNGTTAGAVEIRWWGDAVLESASSPTGSRWEPWALPVISQFEEHIAVVPVTGARRFFRTVSRE